MIKKTTVRKTSHQNGKVCKLELIELARVQQCDDVSFWLDHFVDGHEDLDDEIEFRFVKGK